MPENKAEQKNTELLVILRSSKLSQLESDIASLKEKSRNIAKLIDEKRQELGFVDAKTEQTLNAEPVEKAPETEKAEPIAEAVEKDVKEEVKETPTPAPEVKDVVEKAPEAVKAEPVKQEKKQKGQQPPKPKYENEAIVTDKDGKVRRVYVPPIAEKPDKSKAQQRKGDAKPQQRPVERNMQGYTPVRPQPRPQRGGMAIPPPPIAAGKNTKKTKTKPGANPQQGSKNFDDHSSNKRSLIKKGFIVDDRVEYDENGEEIVRSAHRSATKQRSSGSTAQARIDHAVITTDPVPIKTLSEKIGKSAAEIVSKLFLLGELKTINDSVDFATAELIATEWGIELEFKGDITYEETLSQQLEVEDIEDELVERPPIITIMGHVDHGKTSLLDYIRKSNITGGEAGGITQAIGAYTVTLNGKPITFLDTPGHEAFTSMRARGAQVTDIAILVVAADDGIMPQTIEAINHAKQANVPIIVALNKMDKSGADPDRVLQQLTEHNIVPEEWGGDTPVVKVSAKTGMGVEELLEQILVRAEVEELRANPNRSARGTIIEAKLDKGLGKTATILVQTGTLKIGDCVVAGVCTGKIRAMINDKGVKVKTAGPSMPVSVTGWNDVPEAGDRIDVVSDEKFAKQLAEERRLKLEAAGNENKSVSLNDLFDKISKGELKSVKLIVKADVQGSVEAVIQSLAKLGNEEVSIDIIHSAVGGIKESDVLLAETAGAIIIGFNVRPDANAKQLAAQKKIDIRFYDIIYNAIEDVEKAVKGMLAPKFKEVVLGSAEIRELFKISGVGTIAGCHVVDGKITRTAQARLIRNGKVEYNGAIASLRHGKEDVKEIARNYDCGIMLQNYQDVKVGDVIEAYVMEQIEQ